ncbi:hypothetical protein LTR17_020958 [Elasticomyces elasticus]|nr:hypothetical protein LTR17_020958 [Elasticomyces elasticus]
MAVYLLRKLPLDVKTKIYTMVLTHNDDCLAHTNEGNCHGQVVPYTGIEHTQRTRHGTSSGHLCTAECLLPPALTRATHQIRDETLPLFYGVNHFKVWISDFPEDRTVLTWINSIGLNISATKQLVLMSERYWAVWTWEHDTVWVGVQDVNVGDTDMLKRNFARLIAPLGLVANANPSPQLFDGKRMLIACVKISNHNELTAVMAAVAKGVLMEI